MSAVISLSPSVPASRPIVLLPPSTRSLLRSAPLLFSLPQCIAELVENALDAAASHIHIVVDCTRLSFSVADDGRGMDREELERCGLRHWTTKSDKRGERGQCVFGARGEALASLADVATVDITTTTAGSRHRQSGSSSTFSSFTPPPSRHRHPSSYHKRLTAASTTAVTPLTFSSPQSHGTTVAVTHLYTNLPVRRRLLLSRRDRERELIKRRIERIALVHRHVVFTVWDDEHRRQLLSKGRLTDLPSSFGELYRYDLATSFLPVMKLEEVGVGVWLYVSSLTAGYHTRDYQFVYINRRPVLHTTLQRLISQCWQRCRVFMEGGPTPGMRVLHAVCVLLLDMDDGSYDCLLQSDKQVVVMADEEAVMDAVRRCLHSGLTSEYPVLNEKANDLFDDVDGGHEREAAEEKEGSGEKESDSGVASGVFIDLTGDVTVHLPSRTYSNLGDTRRVATASSDADTRSSTSHPRRSFSSFNYSEERDTTSSTYHRLIEASTAASAAVVDMPPSPQPSDEVIQLLDEVGVVDAVDEQHVQLSERADSDATVPLNRMAAERTILTEAVQSEDETSYSPAVIAVDDEVVGQSLFPVFHESNKPDTPAAHSRSSKRRRDDGEMTEGRAKHRIDLTGAERSARSGRAAGSISVNSMVALSESSSPPKLRASSSSVLVPVAEPVSHLLIAPRRPVRSLQPAFDEGEHRLPHVTAIADNTAPADVVDLSPPSQSMVFNSTTQRFLSSQAECLNFRSSATHHFRSSSPSRPAVLSLQKRMLHNAHIVGQVNSMYVLCLLDNCHLVAVDQHAADERVRLEDLEAHIAQLVGSQALSQPLECQLTSIEAGTLELYRQQVDTWGWRLVQGSEQHAHTHTITHCPALLLPPSACLDSVTSLHDYLTQLSQSLRSPCQRQLPTSLLSLLHSRSCKSAIRFGDRLSTPQQVALVRALSQCQLPFQCAHGRPSMQPLTDVIVRERHGQKQAQVEGSGETVPSWWKEQVRKKLGGLSLVRGTEEAAAETGVGLALLP